MKLDLNAEYRTHLFWKLDAAAFIDAGNIWTLRDYADQPGWTVPFSKDFYKQIAVATDSVFVLTSITSSFVLMVV